MRCRVRIRVESEFSLAPAPLSGHTQFVPWSRKQLSSALPIFPFYKFNFSADDGRVFSRADFTDADLTPLIHGASAGAARVAARSTGAASRSWCAARAFGGDGEDRELWIEFGGMALRALGLLLAIDQRLKAVIAFATDVFKNRHGTLPLQR